jgi:3-deoxy-7-phosphoheptulonate synthase
MTGGLSNLSILRRNWPAYVDSGTTHIVDVAGVRVGGAHPVVIAGPCAVESYEQTLGAARAVAAAGARLLRGGAFKPRTSPYSFQGLGEEGLGILARVRDETGLGVVTEVQDPRMVEQVAATADMLQVGSRSMQNFPLLLEVGRAGVPVLLKRGFSATLEEWLCAAEYVAREGNLDIVLCERGIRRDCSWSHARSQFDLEVIEPLRRATPLPVIGDPSHATGDWTRVEEVSRAALEVGVHGLLIEVLAPGTERSELRCDPHQGVPEDTLLASGRTVPAVPIETPVPASAES